MFSSPSPRIFSRPATYTCWCMRTDCLDRQCCTVPVVSHAIVKRSDPRRHQCLCGSRGTVYLQIRRRSAIRRKRFSGHSESLGRTMVTFTPHYAQSNGHAGVAVKAVKSLVLKCVSAGDLSSETFLRGLLELRNTPDKLVFLPRRSCLATSSAPAYRHTDQRSSLAGHSPWTLENVRPSSTSQQRGITTSTPKPLRPLKLGRVQDTVSKLWSHVGTIVGIGRHRDYRVKSSSGAVMWRNRRFL